MPTGKGTKTINHIGAPTASVIAPSETTENPIKNACHMAIPSLMIKLPMSYEMAVRTIAKKNLLHISYCFNSSIVSSYFTIIIQLLSLFYRIIELTGAINMEEGGLFLNVQ